MAGNQKKSKNSKYGIYVQDKHQEKNKERRKVKHEKYLSKCLKASDERLNLLGVACQKTKKSECQLRKMIGTLNSRRLSQIIDNTYMDSQWFKTRQAAKEEKKHDQITKVYSKEKKINSKEK